MSGLPVAGVVLAAGRSARMESGFKLLLPWGDGVVVRGPVEAVLAAGLDPVVVVTGHRADEVRRALRRALPAGADRLRFVHNPHHGQGQGTSLARGVRAVRERTDAAAAAVVLGDEPGLRAGAVVRTVQAWRDAAAGEGPPPVVRARYADRVGHPVVFPRDVFGALEELTGDRGARRWLGRGGARVEEAALDRPAPVDVDTDADYRAARRAGRGEDRGEEERPGPGPGGREAEGEAGR